MKKFFICSALAFATFSAGAADFTLKSTELQAGKPIPVKYSFNSFSCVGENISPSFVWSNVPVGTKSFAFTVHDPDAVTGGAGFWHWVVVDVPSSAKMFALGAGTKDGSGLPAGSKQIPTDFGVAGWGGPCPPVGDKPHRYNFTVYALKTETLGLPENATASLAGFMINQNAIGKATFTSTFAR